MKPLLLRQHDNVTTTVMNLKMTHLIIFIAFLIDNFTKNLVFCPYQSPLQKFNSKISNTTNLGMNPPPHIFGHSFLKKLCKKHTQKL